MRQAVEISLQGRSLPLIRAHRGGSFHDKENTVAAIEKALIFKPDMIEVDVRKSRDGVLYCHHGSEPWGVLFAAFFPFLTFSSIQKLIGPRNTLREILAAIPDSILVNVDIKDSRITAVDLRPLLAERSGVWIAIWMLAGVDRAADRLKTFRRELGETHFYAFNRPVLRPIRAARKLDGIADLIVTLVWNWNEKTVSRLDAMGMPCHLSSWLISEEKRMHLVFLSKYRGFFYSLKNLSDIQTVREYFANHKDIK